jgi:hypothetical protein
VVLGKSGPLIWRDWAGEMDVWLVGGGGAGTYGLTGSRARDGWWRGCRGGFVSLKVGSDGEKFSPSVVFREIPYLRRVGRDSI